MHACAYVMCPGVKPGENRLILTDGTPSGTSGVEEALLSLIRFPSLREKMAALKKKKEEHKAQLRAHLAEIDGADLTKIEAQVEKAANGNLENLLNMFLREYVFEHNVDDLEAVLSNALYSTANVVKNPIVNELLNEARWIQSLEPELKRLAEERAKKSKEQAAPAGGRFMGCLIDFINRYKKAHPGKPQEAFKTLEKVADILATKQFFNKDMQLALHAAIKYLAAEKMTKK